MFLVFTTIEIFTNVKLKAGATNVNTISGLFNGLGWLSDLWFVCDGTVRFWYKGPVQTSNFSCAELYYQIRLWKVKRMNQLGSSTDLYLGRPASRMERQKLHGHQFRRRTSSRAESNLHTYFSNLSTAFMIGCIVSCDTWRELTQAWWPFRSRTLELDPPLKTVD